MRSVRLFLVLSLLAIVPTAPHAQAPAITLNVVAWLSGDWQADTATSHVEERWTAPAGKMMVGLSHASRDGRTTAFEYLRIELRDTGIFYVASPNAKKVAEFKLIEATPDRLVFEGGDEHVQRVLYTRQGPGKMTARVEGKFNGEAFFDEYHYTRLSPA